MSAAAVDPAYRQAPDSRALAHIPGCDGWPVLGETVAVVRDLHAVAARHVRDYGPVSRIRLLGQGGLMVTGADLYQRIFQDTEQVFSAEKGYDKQLGAFYPRGLLLMDFDEHRANRRLMQGAFKVAALQRYLEMMQPSIARHVQDWGRAGEIVFYPRIKQLLLEIAARCFLGIVDLGSDGERINRLFLDLNAGMISLLRAELPFGAYGRAKRARRRLEAWFETMIAARRAGGDGDDVLSHMSRDTDEHGQPYAVKTIVDHMIFLLFAAHDTSTSALSHLAMYLGRDAALQGRLRTHLDSFGPGPLAHADLARMDLAEHCFHEAMHTVLHLPTRINHRDPAWWSDPERFDPDRFAPPRSEQRRHPMSFHPFGSGAHKCIGMHFADMTVKAFLHRFVTSYGFATPEGYAPRLEWVPLPKPADGVPLRLSATASGPGR